jgi:transcriptional regulator with XRE-family HTH domain
MNAKEIKESRKKLDLTQAQLAIRLGVSLKTVSNYEKGEAIPESKRALLHSIFNEVNEPTAIYYKKDGVEQKIKQVEDLIEATKKNIKLAQEFGDSDQEEHNKILLKIYNDRLLIITEASENKIIENDY